LVILPFLFRVVGRLFSNETIYYRNICFLM